jgi:protein TonB
VKRNSIYIDVNKNHLTQSELVAYSRGELGIDEMYRLERHIIDCEFCAEALEGLAGMPEGTNVKEVVESINQDIAPPEQTYSRSWIMVAASISLILITSITFWLVNQESGPVPLAQNTGKQAAKDTSDNVQIIPGEEKSEMLAEDNVLTETKIQATKPLTPKDVTAGQSDELKVDLDVAVTRGELNNEPELAVAEDQEFVIKLDEPVQDNIQTDEIPEFAEEQTIETSRKKAQVTPAAAAPESQDSSEAKTMARSAQKVKAYTSMTEPTPVGGNAALKKYIRKNLVYPELARENKIRGEVVLQVTIDKDGKIKAINVTSSLGYGCDKEAIRLLKAGPDWNPGLGDGKPIEATTEVKVKFRP